ncbi:hypothetical protein DMN91_010345 [Ooceraea biroi]|uniref:PUM-HD domain-containing protein n=1 Tax=Ooceraea biroi TaxID=2015173 RepID=A0A3L8DD65_OOCBI|nr:protein penguin [Ooceraea biroi]RLU18102.1 hypothetical protein DMN91_010345 [Ooceraea biroi]
MKRKAKNLDTGSTGAEDDVEETANNQKKKVKFEKPLNNNAAKYPKASFAKKNSKGKDCKVAKHNETKEKKDWLKLKKEKKELREKRKAKKVNDETVYDKIVQAKQISEKLRRSDCKLQDRLTLTRTLHEMLETHYSKVMFSHDMSRVVQCIVKHCEMDTRQAICHEMKPHIVQMLGSKYAKNCVRAVLKYGSREIKNIVISACYGNVVKLMSHAVSAPLVEFTYSTWCTDRDKMYFKQEFYGNLYKHVKVESVKSLSDVFNNAEYLRSATLSLVKANLVRILNKSLVNSSLVHAVTWEFLDACSVEDRSELIVMLQDFIVTLSETKFGARVAAQCIWHGNSKSRKSILKALKENVKTVSTSEYGYVTVLALLDSVDDTVLVKKIILSELQQDLVDIALNEYGKHVILYLVARRDSHYFSPSIVDYLRQGDNNVISKKPVDIREKELLEAVREPLLDAVIADTATWLSTGAIAMVTLAILKVGSGEKLKSAFESVARIVSGVDSKIKENENECNLVEHPGLHIMLKKLIQNDKELLKRQESTFGEILVSHLTAEVLQKWIGFNRACFLLIFLVENESENIVHTLLSKLKPFEENLKSETSSGASILLKKLKANENA